MTVYIHVGYHKTATSWLQQEILPRHPQIDYWHVFSKDHRWIRQVAWDHDFEFCPEHYRALARERSADEPNKTVVISWEGFVGDPFSGACTIRRNADRLHAVFPRAKIIVCLRNQVEMMDSLYRQYVQEGGAASFAKFLKLTPANRVHFSGCYLRYDLLVAHYQHLFGPDAVFVCLYERLKESPEQFLTELFSFVGVALIPIDPAILHARVNRGVSPASLRILRFANRFIAGPLNPVAILPARLISTRRIRHLLQSRLDPLVFERVSLKRCPVEADEMRELEAQFRKGNRALARIVTLPLEEYGYPL